MRERERERERRKERERDTERGGGGGGGGAVSRCRSFAQLGFAQAGLVHTNDSRCRVSCSRRITGPPKVKQKLTPRECYYVHPYAFVASDIQVNLPISWRRSAR